jgi:PKD repeat protein
MRSSVGLVVWAGAAIALASCSDSFEPEGSVSPPDSVVATPLGMRSVRISWFPNTNAAGYVIQRRANLIGSFATIKQLAAGSVRQFVDDSLTPETTYGYRLLALSNKGVESAPSLVAGARTAPWPGIVASVATNPLQLGPPTGYEVTVTRNGDTLQAALAALDEHRFGPLSPGAYRVHLAGVQSNCTLSGGADTTISVTDQGLATLQYASYTVTCRDPTRGSLTVNVATTGDSLDTDGYTMTLTGVADDATLPDSERAYFQQNTFPSQANANRVYASLRAGNYTAELSGVAGNCTVQGASSVSFHLAALEDLTRSFAVACQAGVDPTRPLVWRSRWSTASAPAGSKVSLDVGLDLSGKPGQHVTDVQAKLLYNATVVRLDSLRQVLPWTTTGNEAPAGTVTWLAFVTGAGLADSTTFARFYFTVIGAAGTSTTTGTSLTVIEDLDGTNLIPRTRKSDGTFTVASGGPTNQAPVARPGGPYSGTVGSPLSFNGTGSSDPDGSIASYQWAFGDGMSASGATPAHSYAVAGSYTVALTVTDNGGLTASATTTATVSSGGGANQAPTAVPNGPYSGVAGTPVSFDATGSHDPDGTIATYGWDFGDGSIASGPAPMHSFAAPGTFTVTLTVTDNQGAMGSASTTATITSGSSSTPFTWRSDFGPVNPADSLVALTITLDLSTDITQTPGPEALDSWRVDSLKWDPNVLKFFSFNFGPGGAGSVNPTDRDRGKLVFSGVQAASGSTGLITIARVQFKVVGSSGSRATTVTALGPLLGTAATGSFSYRPYTAVVEGTIQAP